MTPAKKFDPIENRKSTTADTAAPAQQAADVHEHGSEELVSPHAAAPASQAPDAIAKPTPAENTGDQRDTSKIDSLGNPKGAFPTTEAEYHGERKGEQQVLRDQLPIEAHEPLAGSGPRGANVSPEHLSEAKKQETAAAETTRLQQGMSSTDNKDSVGNPKGSFRTEEQGNDEHGARIPDVVTDEVVEEHPPMVGPRGKDAPKESFHRR